VSVSDCVATVEHRIRARSIRESVGGSRQDDGIAQAAEMRATGFQLLDDGQQMADRTGEAVETVSIFLRDFS
jgi:hypothetical protein